MRDEGFARGGKMGGSALLLTACAAVGFVLCATERPACAQTAAAATAAARPAVAETVAPPAAVRAAAPLVPVVPALLARGVAESRVTLRSVGSARRSCSRWLR